MLLRKFECPHTIVIKQQQRHIFFIKKIEKKNYPRHGTVDPRHGTLDPRSSTLDKTDRLHLTRPVIMQIRKMANYNLLLVAISEDTRKYEPINQVNKLKTLL